MYALRAATTAKDCSKEAVKEAILELWEVFINHNNYTKADIISVTCSATDDLNLCYPTSFIRKAGFNNIALLDVCQLKVKDELPRCLRLLIQTKKPGENIYLREAKRLRPEWGHEECRIGSEIIKAREALAKIKPYVPGKPIEEVKRELGLTEVIKLASNENPYGPSKEAVKAMEEALGNISLYPDGRSYLLKESLARELDLTAEEIIVGNGSDEIIKLISETYLNPGDNIVQAKTTFSEYEFGALLMGAEVKKVPLKEFTHDLTSMKAAIDPKTKLVYICNPNNPTGTMVTKAELTAFLQDIPKGIVVIIDEAYIEYVEKDNYFDSLQLMADYPVIVLRTFSKIYGLAGLRVGYGLAKEEFICALEKTREPFNVNLLGQIASRAALLDHKHKEWSYANNLKVKLKFYKECKKRNIEYIKSQTNFVLIKVNAADNIFAELLKKGVIIRSGSSFGLSEYIRVTLGTENQMAKFWQAMDEIGFGGSKQ